MAPVTVVTLAGRDGAVPRLLVESLRAFGGSLAGADVLVMSPEAPASGPAVAGPPDDASSEWVPFAVDASFPAMPFAVKAAAAAAAEERLAGSGSLLAWLDPDTLVVAEPRALALGPDVVLGYRPVHHRNIGSPWDAPIGPFWSGVYEGCGVPPSRITPTTTEAGERIRPYLNAGHFAVRPERRLMAAWRDSLVSLAADPTIAVGMDDLHRVFFHQAVFTGVMLAATTPETAVDLGPGYNYPLHLHDEVPRRRRPASLGDLITVRTEGLLAGPRWKDRTALLSPLHGWLEARLGPSGGPA